MTLYRSDRLVIEEPRPCAEEPDRVHLVGHLRSTTLDEIATLLLEDRWRTLRLRQPAALVAHGPDGELLTLNAECEFSLSRLIDAQSGLAFFHDLITRMELQQ
ncbi:MULTISPECIES: hypothetical protein [Agrobacterium]|jgi:hypothetical protein|uniref:Uncharacterized protein n=1 Tax=Agrobacterium radiobacter TaxID=362 RepID=A0ABD5LM45_AGRRD|nr:MULTISPECIES: hypothetical protein [Agrobacterium tumefaciens complex]MCP2136351.1 hypothetical protein [Rhizobium sp. SLBN-94]KWT79031.1 hypothetical protein ASH09_23060 [Agrobacterium radiobacter]MBB4283201.1 hypothetical protein [Agrobacterium radiobacter]MBB4319893.1 hypothetical protein [Agrobacterium radiobacter]MBB4325122.1 hypothetical protein [Agrobacterium radiobacter]